jgi:short-subunit dehydrogenase
MRALKDEYQVALVTGAGRGLGRQLTLDLLAQGVSVAGLDHCSDGLITLAEQLTPVHAPFAWAQVDVTDATAMETHVRNLERQLKPIDLLIANAALGYETSVVTGQGGDVVQLMQTNLIGVWNSINAVQAGMQARRKGHLVAISSLASFRGLPRMLGYCASKAGVNALMDGLRVELAPFGIHATTICPGYLRTAMVAGNSLPMPFLMGVEQAAKNILWAIRKKKAFYAFPRLMAWRLRLLTCLPRSWQDWILRKMMSTSARGGR